MAWLVVFSLSAAFGPAFLSSVALKTALLAAVALLLPPLARRHPAFAALDRKTQLGAAGWASAADGARAADLVDGAMWSPNYRTYVPA